MLFFENFGFKLDLCFFANFMASPQIFSQPYISAKMTAGIQIGWTFCPGIDYFD